LFTRKLEEKLEETLEEHLKCKCGKTGKIENEKNSKNCKQKYKQKYVGKREQKIKKKFCLLLLTKLKPQHMCDERSEKYREKNVECFF